MAFIIQARIGRGRTVETFAGRLEVGVETLNVAVKRARPELAHNEAFLAALVEWGNKQKEIELDDVVAVLEAGRTEYAYVIQERVIGASLALVLEALKKRRRTMTLPLALHVAERIAGALGHLHERKIVHGGLDPSEILISYAGDVKVGDQELHELDVHCASDLAAVGTTRGASAVYRAPELAPERVPSSPSSDTYALALVLLEMLIGHPIWSSPNMTVAASIAALKDFTHLAQSHADLTRNLVEILALCTDQDPVNRVPSGKELAAGLRRIIAHHDVAVDDPRALGTFVKALIPKLRAEEAPTQMQDPVRLEKLSKDAESVSVLEIDSGSVAIDPDLEKKALDHSDKGAAFQRDGFGGVRMWALPIAPAAPAPGSPGVASALAQEASAGAPPESRSALREVSKVAAAAALASEETRRRGPWHLYVGFAIVALILALMIVHMATRGATVRMTRVTATSIPTGADLYLDEQLVGRTPVETSFAVAKGKVKLRFELAGHEAYEALVETKEDALRYEAVMRPIGTPSP
jgi:serine/threonine protein kinase